MKRIVAAIVIMMSMACQAVMAANIEGRIVDSNNSPMAYVTVWIEGNGMTTVTGLDGSYLLRDVPAGQHQLNASFIGYRKESLQVTVKEDGQNTCDFVMDETCEVMHELFVTPKGESIEEFLLRMVAEHRKKLREVVASYNGRASLYWETDNDSTFNNLPNNIYSPLKFVFRLMGYGKLIEIHHDYPGAKFVVDRNLTFNGKIKGDRQVVSSMKPNFKSDEVAYLEKHSWSLDRNIYDDIYDNFDAKKLEKQRQNRLKAAEQGKEIKSKDSLYVKYIGLYEEDGRDVYVLQKGNTQLHIVDGVWQIKRLTTVGKADKDVRLECRELLPGIFLPVSCYSNVKIDFDSKGMLTKELEDYKKTDRSKLSEKELKRLDKDIATTERFLQHRYWENKRCMSWNYTELKGVKGS